MFSDIILFIKLFSCSFLYNIFILVKLVVMQRSERWINHFYTLFILICQRGIPFFVSVFLWLVKGMEEIYKKLIHNVIITFQFIVEQQRLPHHVYNKEFHEFFVNYGYNLCVRLEALSVKNDLNSDEI